MDDDCLEDALVLKDGFWVGSSSAIEIFGLMIVEIIRAAKNRAKRGNNMLRVGLSKRDMPDLGAELERLRLTAEVLSIPLIFIEI